MEARERGARGAMSPASRSRLALPELQLRLRGDHPRAPHAAEHADPLRCRGRRADRGARRSASTKIELIVLLLAIAFVLVAEMVNTAIEAAVDVASTSFDPMAKLAKDIAAGAVLIAARQRGRRRLPRLLGPGRDRSSTRSSTASRRRAGRADARRARRRRSIARDRGEGVHGARHAAARRAARRATRRSRSPAGWRSRSSSTARSTASSSPRSPSSWRCSWPRRGSRPASTPPSRWPAAALLGALVTLVLFQVFSA